MKSAEVLIVNAFTHDSLGGNPAGVVTDASNLSVSEKKLIAKEVGLSETAFVSNSKNATQEVKFFTPNSQVAMCGHATIATWTVLKEKKSYRPGVYSQELTNGILEVQILEDGSVVMEQELPKFGKKVSVEEISPLLRLPSELFLLQFTPQLVSTGMFDLMIGVNSIESLEKIDPDFEAISNFQRANQEAGIHVFALTPNSQKAVARCRDFCPLLDIPEESATGSATGALLCYLYQYGLLETDQVTQGVWFEQGFGMNRPSDIFGKLRVGQKGGIEKVEIGGKATIIDSRRIEI
jgi:PhzF family phenazine biosynthesis protein